MGLKLFLNIGQANLVRNMLSEQKALLQKSLDKEPTSPTIRDLGEENIQEAERIIHQLDEFIKREQGY